MADPIVNILLKATDQTSGVLNGLGGKLGGLGKIALGLAAGGLAAVTGAMAGGIATSINWGMQLDNLQDLLGTTARESAGLAVMANRVGLSSEDLGRSLSIMTRGLFDAEGAAGPAGKAIEGLGISTQDAAGNTKDSTALFQEIADVIAKMPDGFEKSSLMMDIFGRSGVEMGDLLAAAADGGLSKFQQEAAKLGLNFSQAHIDQIVEFGKKTEFLKSAFQGLGAKIGNAVLPFLTKFLTDSVIPFIDEYGPVFAKWVGDVIPKAFGMFKDAVQPVVDAFKWLLGVIFENEAGLGALFIKFEDGSSYLGAFFEKLGMSEEAANTFSIAIIDISKWVGEMLPKALQFASDMWSNVLLPAITAVWTWMSTVLFPFLVDVVYPWLAVNIPLAVQFLSDMWTNVLQPALEAVWQFIQVAVIPILEVLAKVWLEGVSKSAQFLGNVWKNVLQPAIQAVWSWMSTVLIPFLQNVVYPWLKDNLPKALQTLSDFWNLILKPAMEAVWAFLRDYIIPLFSALWELFTVAGGLALKGLALLWNETLKPALEAVWKFITEKLNPILAELWKWFNDKIMPIINTLVNGALANLRQSFKDIRDAIQWVIDKVLALIEKLKLIKMPKLTLPGLPTPESDLMFAPAGSRAGSLMATNRLTVYGGLHLHGVENGGDLLNQLAQMTIG